MPLISHVIAEHCTLGITSLPSGGGLVGVVRGHRLSQPLYESLVYFHVRVVLLVLVHVRAVRHVRLHKHKIVLQCTKEGNVLFNDALNTFYLPLYGVRHMVKDHSDSEKVNPLPPHRLLLSINSKGSFICTIPQTG